MTEYLTALYDSAFSTWLREAETVWAFPTVLTVHTFGMMLLVGCAWVVDLRLLGIARSIPIGPLRPLFRIMWAAFWINLATGILLFIADPVRKATSLLFGFKDDVVVRITPLPAGSRIDIRSRSRVGRGDTGTNAQRVRAYLKRLN